MRETFAAAIVVILCAGGTGSAQAQASFDGLYRGKMTLVKNKTSYQCQTEIPTTYTVAKSHLVSPVGNSSLKFESPVASDGSFRADVTWDQNKRVLEGRIRGNVLEGTFESHVC